ncbi:MAG: hypothetical protein IJQ34_04320 [Kiritimatiellae bacterium]|nr:hypothetical protein [Kiritimatiellia bacterium]
MTSDDRQFLLTAAWLFMRHGKRSRALAVCEALIEDNPRDGVSACALAELLLDVGDANRAIDIIRASDMPRNLEHAAAVLETRALRMLARNAEAADRWNRYIESTKGSSRTWIAQ